MELPIIDLGNVTVQTDFWLTSMQDQDTWESMRREIKLNASPACCAPTCSAPQPHSGQRP